MNGRRFILTMLLVGCVVLSGCGDDDPTGPTTGSIHGRVSAAEGDVALAGALVTSSPPTSAIVTDGEGNYVIPDVSGGQYVITASKDTYNTGSVSISVTVGKTTTANIQLTTGNRPPSPPALISPTDGSEDQPTTSTLIWSANDPDKDPLVYDVFFGKLGGADSKVASGVSDTSFVTARLDTGTTYSWSVVAKDPHGGLVSSPTGVFTTRRDTVPEDGLVAFYPFTGSAVDASGNGHNGSQHGASLATDRFGNPDQAYAFDNTFILVPHAADLSFDPADSLSVELWVFRTEDTAPMHILGKRASCYSGAGNYQLALSYDNKVSGVAEIPLNTWVHLCVTFGGSTMTTYVNGEFRGTSTGVRDAENLVDLKIGNSADCPTPWKGKLDDIRIYRRVLTATEIQRLYHVNGW